MAIKGHPGPRPPPVREIADYLLLLQSHSAVGLVDRTEAAGGGRSRRGPLTRQKVIFIISLVKNYLRERDLVWEGVTRNRR